MRVPAVVLVALCVSALVLAGDPPRLPRDSLPARLAVDLVPHGLEKDRPIPMDNPLSEARVELGRKLFFDPILSANHTVACASCHDPAHGFAAAQPVAVGIHGRRGRRNAPSLLNRAYGRSFFWDGRAASLEAQVLLPIANANELGSSVEEVVKRLREHADYRKRFEAVFADGVSADNLARVIACFERTLLHGNSRVDRFRLGDLTILNEKERRGLWLFESRGRCWQCHSSRDFTDESFHNTGVGWGKEPLDLGRFETTGNDADRGRFKTPTLRGIAETSPYMHDGSLATLEEVVEFYNRGGTKNPHLDPLLTPLGLSKDDVASLAAFLRALSER